MRILELYSGIGGMHYALNESSVNGEIVAAIDINTIANNVYKLNFPKTLNMSRNIQSLNMEEINKLNIDAILMSPPCQPFTRIGLKKDILDNRCYSLFHILELLPQITTLKYILVENVQGFETSVTRKKLISSLKMSKFNYKELLLSPCQFGIPNSRRRYYLIGKKKGIPFLFDESALTESIPETILSIMPVNQYELLAKKDNILNARTSRKCYTLNHILENTVDSKYLIPQKILKKRAHILDIQTANSNGTCCFTKAYSHYVEGTGSVFCPYSENEISETFKQLNGEKEVSDEKLKILTNLNLRYFTPKEVSRLMCFPDNFKFPESMTDKQKYRLLGNSINIYVVSILIYLLNCEEFC